ncbi:GFA family protein [Stutzerimonas zhaodongensis]|uniref:GFA family protein n=1 Tax=Stutzerimonas TaxID=2901164 RepID=UPI00388E1975
MIAGRCRCGAASYCLTSEELPAVYACHCLDCQRWNSSAFGLHALLPEAALSITGPVTEYTHAHERIQSTHYLCSHCHTRLYNKTTAAPGMIVLRAGTLDMSESIEPAAHIWTRRKQAWLTLPDDVPSWPESPSPQDFMQAIQARFG